MTWLTEQVQLLLDTPNGGFVLMAFGILVITVILFGYYTVAKSIGFVSRLDDNRPVQDKSHAEYCKNPHWTIYRSPTGHVLKECDCGGVAYAWEGVDRGR